VQTFLLMQDRTIRKNWYTDIISSTSHSKCLVDHAVQTAGPRKPAMKPTLLVLELWGIGDLALASPFLRKASEKYNVTLVARPTACELRLRFWSHVDILAFSAPWTVFKGKYKVHRWPWGSVLRVVQTIRDKEFDFAVSARCDPRDHLLMWLMGAKRRFGFSRLGSQMLLTDCLHAGTGVAHRYAHWRLLARELGFELPEHDVLTRPRERTTIVVHTGAGQPVRVWPLDRYLRLVRHLGQQGYAVQLLCDSDQLPFWQKHEQRAIAPSSVSALLVHLDTAAIFIGNDSGPGHLAAISGVPTFTIFGPQLPSVFAPIHPGSEWIEGAPCHYKPCFDSCRFATPHCLVNIDEETICKKVEAFIANQLRASLTFEPKLARLACPPRSMSISRLWHS
jgi:ADP-heptose:LPS heptosyltransferase